MSSDLFEAGSRLGKYEVLAHVADGGMGAVYRAVDTELRRTVALKVLFREVAQNATTLERFRREARHAARLNHPNIVALYECGHDPVRDLHYLVLEFVSGIDLRRYIETRGQLQPEEARIILKQATKALCHAFEQGIVHRDIKPSNFLLARVSGRCVVKLTDMGLARKHNDDEYRVTREGNTVGTIDYISPEQARNSASADFRSDIYSLGCTAYHMLAGQPPFPGGGLGERLVKHLQTPAPDVRQFNREVSAEFWAILEKMLAKAPEDRFGTPHELLRALKAVESTDSSPPTVLDLADSDVTILGLDDPKTARSTKREGKKTAQPHEVSGSAKTRSINNGPKRKLTSTPEQTRAASAFHERALQVLAEGGGEDYARQLLINCLNLDPFNTAFRQSLRDINQKANEGFLKRWFGSLNVLAIKSKLHLARSSANWRKVLEHGEDVLAQHPADVDTHLLMAEAAANLGAPALALWLLEKGSEQSPQDASLLRATALQHESRESWDCAADLWEKVQAIDPNDPQATHKINEMLANSHLAKSRSR